MNHDSRKVSEVMTSRMTLRNYDCYEPLVDTLQQECPGLNIPQVSNEGSVYLMIHSTHFIYGYPIYAVGSTDS